jgi:regulator of cell morphogenesis and NO signaling
MKNQILNDLVTQNSVFAYVLHYFGISFYEYSDKTLEEVCAQKNLNVNKVIANLKNAALSSSLNKHELIDYPIELIIEYLKHTHHHFAKYKLPFLNSIIRSFEEIHNCEYRSLLNDLVEIFPTFNQEFVEHIYEEEDELFGYVLELSKFINGEKINENKIILSMSSHFLQRHAIDHGLHESGMEGIKKITKNYYTPPNAPVHLKVIMQSLKDFEEELLIHAKIENEIFFPKALVIENKAKKLIEQKAKLN